MANFIQSSKVLNALRGNDFQVKKEALDTIDEVVGRMLDVLVEGTQSEDIKSIGSDDVFRLFRKPKSSVDVLANKDTDKKGCSRCGGIKDKFVQHGRNIQELVSDEALIMYNKTQ